jgi:hypothetical protein
MLIYNKNRIKWHDHEWCQDTFGDWGPDLIRRQNCRCKAGMNQRVDVRAILTGLLSDLLKRTGLQ